MVRANVIWIQIRNIDDIETGLRVGRIDVVRGQQAVALRADVATLEHGVAAQIALDGQVVLSSVLRAQVRLEFSVEKDGAKQRQIGGLTFGGGDDAAERVGSGVLALIHKRSVEEYVGQRGTAAERRLSAKLS